MSPVIRINGEIVADVPDDTGWYKASNGTPLYVDTDGVDAHRHRQNIKLVGSSIGGSRKVGLTLEGKGNSGNLKKGGDGQEPHLEVILNDHPIRVTYSPRELVLLLTDRGPYLGYQYGERRTLHNPRWVRDHG